MILLFFFSIIFFPLLSWAGLDEVTIFTQDKMCAIRYLSKHPKHNWYIKVDPKFCQNGFVEGVADVQLYSATKEKMETLGGRFVQGYWIDQFPLVGKIIDRFSPSDSIQSLLYLLGQDTEANITYVGQLRSVQPEGRSYGPFQGCPDFRVLVVVSDMSVFENEAFLDKIVQQGLEYAHSYCSSPEIVAFFGSTSMTQSEIGFQMQIDVASGNRTIIPISKKNEIEKLIPTELREEKTDILLSVKPVKEKTVVSYKIPESIVSVSPTISEKKKDILGHLKILSRTSKSNISGRTVVHIKNILLDGTGITDLPEEIQLVYYPGLKTGWAVVEGTVHEDKMQVSGVQFCEQEWCTDVP